MPAHSDTFPWVSYYGHYNFFEERMQSHSQVLNLRNTEGGTYEIDLADGRTLRTFICECYSYGLAEYYETVENLGNIDAVIINSNWCSYTMEAKRHCKEQKVGLFNIGDFMAALNRKDFWDYLTEYEKEHLNDK